MTSRTFTTRWLFCPEAIAFERLLALGIRRTSVGQLSGASGWEVVIHRDEHEGQAVVAIPLSRWGRAITENMALMASTPDAVILNTRQNHFEVSFGFDPTFDRQKETGPACATVKF